MKADEDLLPSELYIRFKDHTEEEPLDHESLLVNLLSAISTLGDIPSSSDFLSLSRDFHINQDQEFDLVAFIFQSITQGYTLPIKPKNNVGDGTKREDDFLLYEWSMGLRHTHDLVKHITPFELHFLASNSILLSGDQTISHRILCLLLCTHSLQQCPLALKKRWKRWQSLVCETLRIFQDSIPQLDGNGGGVDSSLRIVSIFVLHVVQPCLHTIIQLPRENLYHVAMFSSLVGTCTKLLELVVDRCQEELSRGSGDADNISLQLSESVATVQGTVHSIISSFGRFGGFFEARLWTEPMRLPRDDEVDRNENVDFLMHQGSLSWWVHHRLRHDPEERVANMDTSFSETGLGLLAMKAFKERPLVYHPNFVWTIWFPYVIVLFRKSSECPYVLQNVTTQYLEHLVLVVPKQSLVLEKTICGKDYPPLELFHLLSNLLIAGVQKPNDTEQGKDTESVQNTEEEEYEFQMRSQRTVRLIKALLSRFTTVSQVQIVEKMVRNSSSPALQARFLDLLRPLIKIPDFETEKLLWNLLMSLSDDLFTNYLDVKEQVLIDVDVLISRDVEISVGAITMIQMWSLVEGKVLPIDQKAMDKLRAFRVALQKSIDRWSEDSSLAPKFHYRLFLLDSALHNTYNSIIQQNTTIRKSRD